MLKILLIYNRKSSSDAVIPKKDLYNNDKNDLSLCKIINLLIYKILLSLFF